MATNHNIIYIGETKSGLIKIGVTQQTPYRRCYNTDYQIKYFYDAGKNTITRSCLFEAEKLLKLFMNNKFNKVGNTHDYYYGNIDQAITFFINTIPYIEKALGIRFGEIQKHESEADILHLLELLEE